jgi:hypothetical protein
MRLVIRDAAFNPFLFDSSTSVPYRFHVKYTDADAVLDMPTALYFREMLHVYPTARFILTTRGMDDWKKVFMKHVDEIEAHYDGFIPYRIKALLLHAFGSLTDGDEMMAHHAAHLDAVRVAVPANQLLEIDVTAPGSLSAVCRFLGLSDGLCREPGNASIAHAESRHMNHAHGFNKQIPERSFFFPEIFSQPWKSKQQYALTCVKDSSGTEAVGYKPWAPSKHAFVGLITLFGEKNRKSNELGSALLQSFVSLVNLRRLQAKHDVVMLVVGELSARVIGMFETEGIRVVSMPTVCGDLENPYGKTEDKRFVDINRAKLRLWSMTEYDQVYYLDGDVMITSSEGVFDDNGRLLAGNKGLLSPINGGRMVVKTSLQTFNNMYDVACSLDYSHRIGWMEIGPVNQNTYEVIDWNFHGANTDQGLFHFFTLQHWASIVVEATTGFVHFSGPSKVMRAKSLTRYPVKSYSAALSFLRLTANLTLSYPTSMNIGQSLVFRLMHVSNVSDRLFLISVHD